MIFSVKVRCVLQLMLISIEKLTKIIGSAKDKRHSLTWFNLLLLYSKHTSTALFVPAWLLMRWWWLHRLSRKLSSTTQGSIRSSSWTWIWIACVNCAIAWTSSYCAHSQEHACACRPLRRSPFWPKKSKTFNFENTFRNVVPISSRFGAERFWWIPMNFQLER